MSSWSRRVLTGVVVALLGLDTFAAYAVGRADRAPSFRRGGEFVAASQPRGVPYSPAPEDTRFATTTSVVAAARTTTRATTPATTAARPVAAPASPANGLPSLGTYRYTVDGTESATGFGGRRFPDHLTMVAHRSPGLDKDEVVLDLTFSPQHEEREILRYSPATVAFSFEGGSVTFGSATQTSQASYNPTMTQVLLSSASRQVGTSAALAGDGSTTRTEDWSVTRVGRETVTIAGAPVATVVFSIHRQTRPGSADQLQRDRRYWYDPARHIWVKWTETMRGARKVLGLTFVYNNQYTAVLSSFTGSG